MVEFADKTIKDNLKNETDVLNPILWSPITIFLGWANKGVEHILKAKNITDSMQYVYDQLEHNPNVSLTSNNTKFDNITTALLNDISDVFIEAIDNSELTIPSDKSNEELGNIALKQFLDFLKKKEFKPKDFAMYPMEAIRNFKHKLQDLSDLVWRKFSNE